MTDPRKSAVVGLTKKGDLLIRWGDSALPTRRERDAARKELASFVKGRTRFNREDTFRIFNLVADIGGTGNDREAK